MLDRLKKEWSNKNGISIEEAIPKLKYTWVCDKGHEWVTSLGNRKYQNTKCPYCNSKKTTFENNLKVKFPEISEEWDYDKNDSNPENFLPYSNKRIYWKCKQGHTWQATINNRTSKNNKCPICFKNESWCENYIYSVLQSITTVTKLNDPEIDIYLNDLNIGIEYDGYYHKFRYEMDIKKNIWASKNLNLLIRIRESYLPELPKNEKVIIIHQDKSDKKSCQKSIMEIIKILKLNSENLNFDVKVESKIRNTNLPSNIINYWSPNNKTEIQYALKTHKYLWICDKCGSEYESVFRNRMKRNCCPFCTSQKVNSSNSLSKTNPEILKYISKYNDIDPNSITVGTGKKLEFIKNGKEMITTPRNFLRSLREFIEFNYLQE